MIYIGVGPDPFKKSGKGGWEEDGARLSRREWAAEGPFTRFPGPWSWVLGSQVAFIKLVSCCSQEEPPRPHFWGDNWHTGFPISKESHPPWVYGRECYVYACPYSGPCHVCNHLAIQSALWFIVGKKWSSCPSGRKMWDCIVSFLPLDSICCQDVTARWMHFLSVLKVDGYREWFSFQVPSLLIRLLWWTRQSTLPSPNTTSRH